MRNVTVQKIVNGNYKNVKLCFSLVTQARYFTTHTCERDCGYNIFFILKYRNKRNEIGYK